MDGLEITGYKYSLSTSSDNVTYTSYGPYQNASWSSGNAFTISGLTNGTFYKIKIRAVNALGDGEESQEIGPFKPNTIPGTISAPSVSRGTASSTTDTFSWTAPNNGGSTITKYGYQLSTNNGSSWGTETETASTSLVYAAGYTSTNTHLRVRAFNNGSNGGWGSYSLISSNSAGGWTNNTGTDSASQTDSTCGPAGCSQSQSDTSCSDCSETENRNCECGTQSRTRTRSRSRSRSRTRSSSRTRSRSRSTQYWSRSGNTDSSITYGSWSISDYEWNLGASSSVGWSEYSYGSWNISDYEWNLGTSSTVGWSAFTYTSYPDWSTISFSPCAGGTLNNVVIVDGRPFVPSKGVYVEYNFLAGGNLWCDASGSYLYGCAGGYGLLGPDELYWCNTTGTYSHVGDQCNIVSCC